MTKDTDYAWAAGFWDGEGCVSLTFRQFSDSTPAIPRIVVQVAQVDRRVLDKFKNIVDYGNVLGPYAPRTKNSQPYYVWRVEGVPHLKTIRDHLAPFLSVVKLEQIDSALEARLNWEQNAHCHTHGDKITQTTAGTWRCATCLSEAGKKAAIARWGSKENDL